MVNTFIVNAGSQNRIEFMAKPLARVKQLLAHALEALFQTPNACYEKNLFRAVMRFGRSYCARGHGVHFYGWNHPARALKRVGPNVTKVDL